MHARRIKFSSSPANFRSLFQRRSFALLLNCTAGREGAQSSAQPLGMAAVIVVGAGLAGLCATFEAAAAGAHVFLLEKEKTVGGNSAKATSGMNGLLTPAQFEAGIADSAEMFMSDTLASGHGLSDPELVLTLISGAHDAVEFARARGVALDAVTLCGGHSVARTHHEKPRADGKPTPVG